jgi:hypothetical protein
MSVAPVRADNKQCRVAALMAVFLLAWCVSLPALAAPPEAGAVEDAAFARRVSLEADAMPLRDALATLARQAQLELELDVPALQQVQLDVAESVTITIEDKPLAEALAALAPWEKLFGTVWRIRDGKLVITTLRAERDRYVRRLPEWLRPYYGHGVVASLDDEDNVVSIAVGQIVSDDLLAKFKILPKLRELHISTTNQLTPAGLKHLSELPELEKLTLYALGSEKHWLGDTAIECVLGLKSLRDLTLNMCGTTDAGAERLESMTQLTSLSLDSEGRLTDAALASIAKLKHLKRLHLSCYGGSVQLGRMEFNSDGIRQLCGLDELEHLDLTGQTVPADAITWRHLKTLRLGMEGINDAGAARIAQVRGLEVLSLFYTDITDEGLKEIAKLPGMRRLSLDSRFVTDAGIANLSTLTTLESLSLRGTNLTDESLGYVAQLKNLERLDLPNGGLEPGQGFSIAGVERLKALPKLQTLWLDNVLHSKDLFKLKELKQLRELKLHGWDPAQVSELQEALPNTHIGNSPVSESEVILRPQNWNPRRPGNVAF